MITYSSEQQPRAPITHGSTTPQSLNQTSTDTSRVSIPSGVNASIISSTEPSPRSDPTSPSPHVTSPVLGTGVRPGISNSGAASGAGHASSVARIDSSTPSTATTGKKPSQFTSPAPGTSPPSSRTSSSLPSRTSAAADDNLVYDDDLVAFVRSGRDWVSNLAKPGIISKASKDVEMLLRSTKRRIEHLGGTIPSPLGGCSNGSKHKRRAGLFSIVQDLIGDALGLARCVEAIAEDLSAEIRQLNRQPPSPEMVQLIEEQLGALKEVSEEQEDGRSSTADSASSIPESTISTSPSPSPSSSTDSSSSTTVESCSATYTGQVNDEDDAPDYRRSLVKDRRHSAAVLIRRKKGPPRSIDTIGDAKSGCKFPGQKSAIQLIWLEYGGFIKLNNQPNGQKGANKRVYDAASKWYVVARADEKAIIERFLKHRIPSPNFDCADMDQVFFSSCNGEPTNRVQDLLDQLPGMQFGPGN
ncbi:MAG: hypothetical protein Q9210_005482 [Variospora velana]